LVRVPAKAPEQAVAPPVPLAVFQVNAHGIVDRAGEDSLQPASQLIGELRADSDVGRG